MQCKRKYTFILWLFLMLCFVGCPEPSSAPVGGAIDSSFGSGGKVFTSIGTSDYLYALGVQGDGKIVAAGSINGGPNMAIVVLRYNSNGSLDNVFGTSGMVVTDVGSTNDIAYALIIQGDGKIVVGGDSGSRFLLMRYNADGSLDTDFGADGVTTTVIGNFGCQAYALAIQTDGKYVLAGCYRPSGYNGTRDFVLARTIQMAA
jgi:uncharacterized delta-60 repeat protein